MQAKDLAGGTAGRIRYGGHKFGGEAYFAPSGGRDEDAGHLLTFVHDEDANVTELQVFDAKTMAEKVRTVGLLGPTAACCQSASVCTLSTPP